MNTLNSSFLKNTEAQQTTDSNEKNIQLQIPVGHAGTMVAWLVEQSIPFRLNFSESILLPPTLPSNLHQTPKHKLNQQSKNSIEVVNQKYILDHLEGNPPKIEVIAAEYGMSTQTFKNKFQKQYGKSFYQVYLEKKMDHAAKLLKQGLTASAISDRIGYSHPIKFNKMFQKHFGITPKRYQMQFRRG